MQVLKSILAVFIGGGAGSLARWGISLWLLPYTQQFPTGTLVANLLSCFLVGILLAFTNHPFWGTTTVRLLLITGFCGGFSTFSTLMRECFDMIETDRFSVSLLYGGLSFVLGIVTLISGLWIGSKFI